MSSTSLSSDITYVVDVMHAESFSVIHHTLDNILYAAKHLRGKLLRLESKMNAHGKTFMVAAPFDNEYLLLVNYSM